MNKRTGLSVVLTTKQYRNSGRMCRKYKYLVHLHGCTSFTAFVGRKAFRNWMKERGLKIGERMSKYTYRIIGTFHDVYAQPLPTKNCIQSIDLHNGTYTECMIGENENAVLCSKHTLSYPDFPVHSAIIRAWQTHTLYPLS